MHSELHIYVFFAARIGLPGNLGGFWKNLNGFLSKVTEIFP